MSTPSNRVLVALSDKQDRHITAVCLSSECTLDQLQQMNAAGLIRFLAKSAAGSKVCITPKGLEVLWRQGKGKMEERMAER